MVDVNELLLELLTSQLDTEGAVGQAIFSQCILSVIISLIFSKQDPPGCSPHTHGLIYKGHGSYLF